MLTQHHHDHPEPALAPPSAEAALAPPGEAALAPAREALRWGLGLSACGALVAWAAWGSEAAAAVAVGGVISVAAGHALAQSMAALLTMVAESPERVRAGQRWALVASILRYPMLGVAMYAAVDWAGLPIAGLAAGVTLWPACLAAACLRTALAPSVAAT